MTANIIKSPYQIPINKPLIDSFSLRIALKDVTVIDHRLTSPTFIYYESTDEISEERNPPKPIIIII